ncbi:FAD-dependent oxidoreductase [Azospirillum sp. RWY-5-1]|uniref:FAD-dependent oxidoreductase n=1 Tax=Azospirillum oleiclasticum TaxID=2735135 RepID=A0ABX2T8V2_9PROT|nr:FAD-dependent oxidoreductase [Azospirillum oleiclasticum]NYZ11955.1 FAD-dependent oxidoreductase [Azospirillum oleiclasticum]NYZ19115.1 FAD-dependent oxidoreductase [Azospirillum oleiclasticum]
MASERTLVLVGGGHSHVQVLRGFGERPEPGVRLTLVSRDLQAPYSGMLPGFIAGHYRFGECHIDLHPLATFAGATLIHDEVTGIDRAAKRLRLRNGAPLPYDLLSLDIGSTPKAEDVPGAAEHAIAVKPVDRLAERWARLVEEVRAAAAPPTLVLVGGGPAGVEMILAMQHRFRTLLGDPPERQPRFALVTRGGLLERHNRFVRAAFRRVLARRNVAVHEDAAVERVEAGCLHIANGRRITFDTALWAVQAGAAPWLAGTGLDLDAGGFVIVEETLRSTNDPCVFAAGDVASMQGHPREKAGVIAVRHGPPLAANLRRALAGEPLRPFVPQSQWLALISTGDRHAVASRGWLYAEGNWVWRVKDGIDRRFMRRFQELPPQTG